MTAPHPELHEHPSTDREQRLPSLVLPPAPFSHAPAKATPQLIAPVGASIDELLAQFSSAPTAPASSSAAPAPDPVPALAPAPAPAQVHAHANAAAPLAPTPQPTDPPAREPAHLPEAGGLALFSSAVERRRVSAERREAVRLTPDRRAFASQHLATPATGPDDPRPVAPPPVNDAYLPAPINPRMPILPDVTALEPSRPWTARDRSGAGATSPVRTSRAGVHVTAQHPAVPAPHADVMGPPRASAPEPLTAADAAVAGSSMPDFGPAGPSLAPAAGLPAPIAAAAASPAAWFGGETNVDDGMLVWNAPGTGADLPAAVIMMPATFEPESRVRIGGAIRFLLMLVAASGAGVAVAVAAHALFG